jgi:hypothetical protein
MNRSRGKSQVPLGLVLIALLLLGVAALFGALSVTGFFAGNFTIPFGFVNVTEEICHNQTVKTNCYNETIDVCRNVFNGTVEVCDETGCEVVPTYESVCEQELNETCEYENVTVCGNFTKSGYDFSKSEKNYTMGNGVFVTDFRISPDFGQCNDNYTVSMMAYNNESLNFSIALFMKDSTGKAFLIDEKEIGEGTSVDEKEEVNFTFSNFCNMSLVYDSELIIQSNISSIVQKKPEAGSQPITNVPKVECSERLSDLIKYYPEENTIRVVGDGICFTKDNPATPEDIYKVDQENGWNKTTIFYTLFILDAKLEIGDGESDTWLLFSKDHLRLNEPMEVLPKGHLQFGIPDQRGIWIEANVSTEDSLSHGSAIYVREGGSLFFYMSDYNVANLMDSEEVNVNGQVFVFSDVVPPLRMDNIYAEEGSSVELKGFTMEREDVNLTTIFYLPSDAMLEDVNFVHGGEYVFSDNETVDEGAVLEQMHEDLKKIPKQSREIDESKMHTISCGSTIVVTGGTESSPYTCANIATTCTSQVSSSGNYYVFNAYVSIGDGSTESWLQCTNKMLVFNNYYWYVYNHGNLTFGALSTGGNPQQGCYIEFNGTGGECSLGGGESKLCIASGGTGRFYDTHIVNTAGAGQKANIEAGSGSRLRVRRLTFEGANTGTAADVCNEAISLQITYVPTDTEMIDYAFSWGKYAFELSETPDKTMENINVHHATAGIRMCHAKGSITGYFASENCYDVRMGGYFSLTLKDSVINESLIDFNDCGGSDTGHDEDESYILRQRSIEIKTKDAYNNLLGNVTVASRDSLGVYVMGVSTYDSNGTTPTTPLNFSKIQVNTDGEANQPKAYYTPHEFYVRKYGYKYVKTITSIWNLDKAEKFSTEMVLFDNTCLNLNESSAASQTGITYTPPIHVDWNSTAENQTLGTDDQITLAHTPAISSEQVAIVNVTGLDSGTYGYGIPLSVIPPSNYTVNYSTGVVSFDDGHETKAVRPVYFYGGNITVSSDKTLGNVYDYMQAIQTNYTKGSNYITNVFTVTDDCANYISYVDFILNGSTINQTTEKKINLGEGIKFSAGSNNGTTINVLSDTWNFKWGSNNGTWYRKYTLDVTVRDPDGVVVNNANVTLIDHYGNAVFSINTSSSGTIPRQEVTYAKYNYTDTTVLSPFTIRVTKSPFNDYSAPVDLDRKTTLDIIM